MADLEIVHPGSIEAGDVMASAVDGAGCAIDYDIPSATARVTAKGGAGASTLLVLRTLLAGVLKNVLSFASDGTATFLAAVSTPSGFRAPWSTSGGGNFALDTSSGIAVSGVLLANGAQINLGPFSGLVIVNDTNDTGSTGLFLCSAGLVNLVSSIGGEHAAGYNVASKISMGANAGAMIVTNNMGVSRSINVTAVRTRAAN
jgi:hypothetical protein